MFKIKEKVFGGLTFITTGYMVAPNSKQPFLNMKTLVLLMQVPGENEREGERER